MRALLLNFGYLVSGKYGNINYIQKRNSLKMAIVNILFDHGTKFVDLLFSLFYLQCRQDNYVY